MNLRQRIFFGALSLLLALRESAQAASIPEERERENLKAANAAVEQARGRASEYALATLSSAASQPWRPQSAWPDRSWPQKTWSVLAFRTETDWTSRKAGPIEHEQAQRGEVLEFLYRVEGPEVLSVSPAGDAGALTMEMRLEGDGSLRLAQKRYVAANGRTGSVSPDAIRSRISPMELFPLEPPNLAEADSLDDPGPGSLPTLPLPLREELLRRGMTITVPAGGKWLSTADFWGREVRALWVPGEPWPRYLRTSAGVAVMLGGTGGTGR